MIIYFIYLYITSETRDPPWSLGHWRLSSQSTPVVAPLTPVSLIWTGRESRTCDGPLTVVVVYVYAFDQRPYTMHYVVGRGVGGHSEIARWVDGGGLFFEDLINFIHPFPSCVPLFVTIEIASINDVCSSYVSLHGWTGPEHYFAVEE